ncbi:MAG: hypothetical protein J0H64_03965 [Actinobacteria bacterium]|nr:hypothetical protein [Actinomycetota bacterium]
MSRRTRVGAITAFAVLCVSLVAAIGAILLDITVLNQHPHPPISAGWAGVLPGLAMLVPGCLLLWQLPRHQIAWILSGFGLMWVFDGLASAAVNYAWYFDREAWWAVPAFWFFSRFGSVLLVALVLLLLYFPDGRLLRGWRRGVSWVVIALSLVMPFAFLFAPAAALSADDDSRTELLRVFEPPITTLPLPDQVWALLLEWGAPCLMLALLLALLLCVSRRFGASTLEKAQLRWLVWSGLLFIATAVFVFPAVPTVVVDILLAVTIALVSSSVVIAVTRYRLYQIDRLLSWTLVYGLLITAIVAIDVLLIWLVGNAIDDRTAMLLAAIAVTAAYAPLRTRLFQFANRLVSGRRGDPYTVVSSLGDRLDSSVDTHAQLENLASAIAEAFASPYVRVTLDSSWGTPAFAEYGLLDGPTIDLPITHADSMVGSITMIPGRRPLSSDRDQRLLGDLVRFSVASLRNAELGRELQRIREQLVLAREAERSRLRRDLHDSLGPLLGGVKLRLETARNWVDRDPARALGPLDAAIGEQTGVIEEIRRIVHDLRPPALDDLGLLGALSQVAERLSGAGLVATVSGALPPDGLTPAVEVAAYRIVSEALTNTSRHAHARAASARFDFDEDELHIEVSDDGIGLADDAVPGVGRRTMRERAAELGGTLTITQPETGGTLIRARLPLAHEAVGDQHNHIWPQGI